MADEGVPHDAGVADARARVALRQEAEVEERADRAATVLSEDLLRGEVGVADFETGRRAVQRYLSERSPAELDSIRTSLKLDNPGAATPEQLRALGRLAVGEIPKDPKAIEAELKASRERMGKDPKGWHADDRAQLRYRMLLRAAGRA